MYLVLQVLSLLVVAVAMALVLAHALELPGKLRLDRDAYMIVQPIYYPGFTWGGVSEPLGLLLLAVLAVLAPAGTAEFWLVLGALGALALMHAAYWLLTHRVNRFWLAGTELEGMGKGFFGTGGRDEGAAPDWTELRDRWEGSHVIRAALGVLSFVLLAAAVAM
jgi:hypothetical protein